MTQTSDERRTSHERASGAGNPGRLRFWLLLSMLLNVFLIGGIGGGAWRWWSESAHGDLVRSVTGANPASPRGLRVAADGLTPAQRQAFRSGLRNVRRASAELAQSSREGRAEVARLLASPRFDRSAIDAALARTRASDLELRQSIEAFVVNFAVDLSPADREILVQGLTAQQVRFMFRRRQPAVNSCAIACPVEHRSVQMNPSAIALNRFGLGARPGDAVPANPRSWLLDQFERYQPQPAAWLGQQSTEPLLDAFQVQQREMRNVSNEDRKAARQSLRRGAREDYLLTVNARLSSALDTPSPFVERLVHFWSNHFAISVEKPAVLQLAGAYEVDAIRPHVLGRFDELLLAAVRHPAMLVYLDQAQSVGPASIAAQRAADRKPQRKRGLNENLAREVLELHTLGARSGYTQADVTEFARALTGWSLAGVAGDMRGAGRRSDAEAEPRGFQFRPALHEPGARSVLGRSYAEGGEAQAVAILRDVAVAPATARHVSMKLARHFVADDPPPALVDRLTLAFQRSDGDLLMVYRTLIASPEAWNGGPGKFKTPWDWALSSMRALGHRELKTTQGAPLMNQLGQPVWRPGSPAGYDDIAASWAAPDALVRRVEMAQRFAAQAGNDVDPRDLAPRLLPGDALSEKTVSALARAESSSTALALLLVSPDFLRR